LEQKKVEKNQKNSVSIPDGLALEYEIDKKFHPNFKSMTFGRALPKTTWHFRHTRITNSIFLKNYEKGLSLIINPSRLKDNKESTLFSLAERSEVKSAKRSFASTFKFLLF
jgi:hypothetical protein